MSKVKDAEVVEEAKKPEWKEVRENLVTQHAEHLKQAEHHSKMALKAEGAIEVGDQMNPEATSED
tara:strand:+ start:244 stop:438 length:195 start_codon:yes stop_codon:yes gene_type:complete